ncbi:MAG: exo-alpha-sialidase [Chloroflexi bacterium]|nr:MAG: exo-alpha-sialidase [Chloroflexota bacterium]
MRRRWWILSAVVLSAALSGQAAYAATGFTTRVSPAGQANATEPSVAVDRTDGTVWVAWQAGGRHVARSDDGGRTFVQTPITNLFGSDIGDVDIRVGGPTPCSTAGGGCTPGTHRVYVTSIEKLPVPLQTHLAFSDDRGATWTENNLAAFNPSFIDRPWLAVYPNPLSAAHDQVYIAYHDFSVSQINVAASNDGGHTFGPSVDVLSTNGIAFANSFCNTVPSGIEADPGTGEVYVEWITADPVANTTQGCNITQIQNFHQVWVAHSPPAVGTSLATVTTTWDAHQVFNGPTNTNTDEIFATLAVDTGGNVYSVFPDNLRSSANFDIWFSHSSNKAMTWSAPVLVNNDGGTNFFPWIAAGSSGRVDFIYLHTPDLAPSDTKLSPWYTKFAQTTDGTDAVPKFAVTSASSGIMHVGGICTNGIFCSVNSGNRDLADSISIAIDRGGSAALAWTDQGTALNGPTDITYGCVTAQQTAIVGADPGLSCKGPAS